MSELHDLELHQVAAAFKNRSLSPVEYADALIARIERADPALNAFVLVQHEELRHQAREAEKEMARSGPRTPMHGIPVAIKDVIDVASLPTTCHSKLQLEQIAAQDAQSVASLRKAGALIAGKTATWEFAIGGPTTDLPFPPARNPWNPAHHPGGSSSGSASAVAARMVPAALGTDTGGSIRLPASHCGIVGLKPTNGLVGTGGVFPLSYSLDVVGPLTRTVRDNAMLLNVIADHPNREDDYTSGLSQGLRGLRIGIIRHFFEHDTVAHPEVISAIHSTVRVLVDAGATAHDIQLPLLDEYQNVLRIIMAGEGAAIHRRWLTERPEGYAALTRQRLAPGLHLTADEYVNAQRRRTELSEAIEDCFSKVDVLITASTMDPACRFDDQAAIDFTHPRQSRVPFNLSGHPALSIMSGLSRERLPLAVQMIGRRWRETDLYGVAAAYEELAGWSHLKPPLG